MALPRTSTSRYADPNSGFDLAVDPIACDGYGMCAELLPELITLDDWGYPMIRPVPVPESVLAHARRAVDSCPVVALRLRAAGRPMGAAPSSPAAAATSVRAGAGVRSATAIRPPSGWR